MAQLIGWDESMKHEMIRRYEEEVALSREWKQQEQEILEHAVALGE